MGYKESGGKRERERVEYWIQGLVQGLLKGYKESGGKGERERDREGESRVLDPGFSPRFIEGL